MSIKKLPVYLFVVFILLSVACQRNLRMPEPVVAPVKVRVMDTVHQVALLPRDQKVKLSPHLMYHYYYGNQLEAAESGYLGRLLHGEYTSFFNRNELLSKGYFVKGLKDGQWKFWYPNGLLREIQEWNGGRKHGKYEAYYSNGLIREKGSFKRGLPQGNRVSYYETGNVEIRQQHRNGVRVGKYLEFYPQGGLKIEARYKEGQLHGNYKLYNEQGALQVERRYRKGFLKEEEKEKTPEEMRKGEVSDQKKWYQLFNRKDKDAEKADQAEQGS